MKIFSTKFVVNMFPLIVLLQYSTYMLIGCEAAEMDTLSKEADVVTSSPILKHLLRNGVWDSGAKTFQTVPETVIPNKDLKNYSYKTHKVDEIDQKGKDLDLDVNQNDGIADVASNNSKSDESKLVYSKLAIAIKTQLYEMIAEAFRKYTHKSNSSKFDSHITPESTDADSSAEKSKARDGTAATARQFVFHPYLPYGKDVAPDEKISIGDVLPVKMVKFFKGMVEDAPWEQMFMKMVRMIVDQFVDKIIEKMFAHKEDDHDEWRSSDGGASAKSVWSLPRNVLTYVVRSRRSTEGKANSEHVQDWAEKDLSSANRVSKEDRAKTKEATQEDSWLDSILDFLFPDDPKAVDDFEKDGRKRRDSGETSQDNFAEVSRIMRGFHARLLGFRNEPVTSESTNSILKESIRLALSNMVPQNHSEMEGSYSSVAESSALTNNTVSDTPVEPKSLAASGTLYLRTKRSADDEVEKTEEEDRLWQASHRPRPSNRKSREDCSLRRACNAGRLLSRLPSVQDITMQLKAYGNEPHWDALLWGMTKKRCSRIFCKRQRSPKGSKHHWDVPEKRLRRKSSPASRSSRWRPDESDLTTIFPV